MFYGQTAWFSQSVADERKRLWKQHGGQEVDFDDAKFIFSEDSECDDTKSLYQSDAYLNEHLAIFHASYISQCVKEEDVAKVVLGKYFLPPTDIQKMTKMNWDWTKQNASDEDESEEELPSKLSSIQVRTDPRVSNDTIKDNPGYQRSMVTDNTTRKRPFSQTDTTSETRRDKTAKRKPATEVVEATSDNEKISSGPSSGIVKKSQAPAVTNYVNIDVLPRMTGVVQDWIPGKNGCQVYLKT